MNRTLLVCTMWLAAVGMGWNHGTCASTPRGTPAAQPGKLALETERVVVFKDGYGLFIKNGVGTVDENGQVHIDEVPAAAVLGAFWAFVDEDRPLLSMTAGWVETIERQTRESTCTNLRELLRVNTGKQVSLELDDKRHIEGTLAGLLELPSAPIDGGPEAPAGTTPVNALYRSSSLRHLDSLAGSAGQPRETSREIEPRGGDLVVLDSPADGRTVLHLSSVRFVSGPELTTRIERTTETTRRTKRLTFDLGKSATGDLVSLRILYFAPGIRWIPTYRIDGDLDDQAFLTLQGEILNEVEDIDSASLDLVVGVPNFRFKNVVSPFVLEATLINALRSAAPDIMGQRMSNTFTQRAGEWRAPAQTVPSASTSIALPDELVADGSQDLFVYGQKTVTIKKGARAAVALWQSTVPLSHVYTMETQLVRNGRTGATRRRGPQASGSLDPSPLRLSSDRVWHWLELVNAGDVPWTTGPAFLMRKSLPLGQELLTYTSPGGRVRVPVTVAVDVRASHDEWEVGRELGAVVIDGHAYTRIRKEGKLTFTNYKDEPIDLEATVSFGGAAESASDDGEIVIDDLNPGDWEDGSTGLNNHSKVNWRLRLDPGQTRTVSYSCVYHVR